MATVEGRIKRRRRPPGTASPLMRSDSESSEEEKAEPRKLEEDEHFFDGQMHSYHEYKGVGAALFKAGSPSNLNDLSKDGARLESEVLNELEREKMEATFVKKRFNRERNKAFQPLALPSMKPTDSDTPRSSDSNRTPTSPLLASRRKSSFRMTQDIIGTPNRRESLRRGSAQSDSGSESYSPQQSKGPMLRQNSNSRILARTDSRKSIVDNPYAGSVQRSRGSFNFGRKNSMISLGAANSDRRGSTKMIPLEEDKEEGLVSVLEDQRTVSEAVEALSQLDHWLQETVRQIHSGGQRDDDNILAISTELDIYTAASREAIAQVYRLSEPLAVVQTRIHSGFVTVVEELIQKYNDALVHAQLEMAKLKKRNTEVSHELRKTTQNQIWLKRRLQGAVKAYDEAKQELDEMTDRTWSVLYEERGNVGPITDTARQVDNFVRNAELQSRTIDKELKKMGFLNQQLKPLPLRVNHQSIQTEEEEDDSPDTEDVGTTMNTRPFQENSDDEQDVENPEPVFDIQELRRFITQIYQAKAAYDIECQEFKRETTILREFVADYFNNLFGVQEEATQMLGRFVASLENEKDSGNDIGVANFLELYKLSRADTLAVQTTDTFLYVLSSMASKGNITKGPNGKLCIGAKSLREILRDLNPTWKTARVSAIVKSIEKSNRQAMGSRVANRIRGADLDMDVVCRVAVLDEWSKDANEVIAKGEAIYASADKMSKGVKGISMASWTSIVKEIDSSASGIAICGLYRQALVESLAEPGLSKADKGKMNKTGFLRTLGGRLLSRKLQLKRIKVELQLNSPESNSEDLFELVDSVWRLSKSQHIPKLTGQPAEKVNLLKEKISGLETLLGREGDPLACWESYRGLLVHLCRLPNPTVATSK